MCGSTRAQNFPCPPSIPFSSLLDGQKGMNFSWEGVNTAATFTLKVSPCHHLGEGALPFLKIPQKISPIPASKSPFPNQPGARGCKFSHCNPRLASPLIPPLSSIPGLVLRGFGKGRGNIIRGDVALGVRAGAGSLKGSGQQKERRGVNLARITEPFRLIRDLMREGV